tara:strand:- start:455 stop:1567 length:1113 start_codon:yes stop_codon:yes gene_type:complete
MKKSKLYVLGLLLLIGAVFASLYIIDSRNPPKSQINQENPLAITKIMLPEDVTVSIPANGILMARKRIEVYSEVQGLMEEGARDFKIGQRYKKGEILLKVNKNEFQASVKALKSNFYTLLASIMPDLSLDYPEAYSKWKAYFDLFDIEKPTPPLPVFSSEGEKYFLVGRKVLNSYYSLLNLETRLYKYTINAPFTGIITKHNINSGELIRPGQALGTFIKDGDYEVNLSLGVAFSNSVSIGQSVDLKILSDERFLKGKISRINAAIDQDTQTIAIIVNVLAKDLQEGLFVSADIQANTISQSYEIPRDLLVQDNKVFTVQKDSLILKQVKRIYYTDETVIIKGLTPGSELLIKPILGAYQGMKVTSKLDN